MNHARTAPNRQTLFLSSVALSVWFLVAGCTDVAPKTDGGADDVCPDETLANEAWLSVPRSLPLGGCRPLTGTVVETMDSGSYTYIRVKAANEAVWAAAAPFTVQVGEQVEVPPGLAIPNYYSKTLGREFDVIYFVGAIRRPAPGDVTASEAELTPGRASLSSIRGPSGHPPVTAPSPCVVAAGFSDVKNAASCQTVAEIFADREAHAGTEVLVCGRVVRFSPRIRGKNWIHLRDGMGEWGTVGLTAIVDTDVKVGDTVIVRGVLSVDRDFGGGYIYPAIIAKATLSFES